ncbi:hypothetical protein L1987_06378 [Smallanthus sonchifolius]|uniref:Uncharacterized protein n=1 Tax=Smallanthus sonchifolius TaxID=185202 RepID=A0ACB9JY53_9ASTR|nr:hypothetical protein L1987_06378 [Smallanthus sonchifolius]
MAAVDEKISLAVKHSQVGTSESNNDKEVDSDDVGETLANEENEAVYPKFISMEQKEIASINEYDVAECNWLNSSELTAILYLISQA